MLQSSGYFSNIICPYFASGFCERPHCHFKHVRKEPSSSIRSDVPSTFDSKADLLKIYSDTLRKIQETEKVLLASSTPTVETPAFVTYIPTPKNVPRRSSQESHIPAMCMPEYKPTPISQLRRMHKDSPFGDPADYTLSVSSYKRKVHEMYSGYSSPQSGKVSKRVEEYDPTKVSRTVICKYSSDQLSGNGSGDEDTDMRAEADFSDSGDEVSTKSKKSEDSVSKAVNSNGNTRTDCVLSQIQNVSDDNNKFDVVTQILQESKSSEVLIKSWSATDTSQPKTVESLASGKTKVRKLVDQADLVKKTDKKHTERDTIDSDVGEPGPKRPKLNNEESRENSLHDNLKSKCVLDITAGQVKDATVVYRKASENKEQLETEKAKRTLSQPDGHSLKETNVNKNSHSTSKKDKIHSGKNGINDTKAVKPALIKAISDNNEQNSHLNDAQNCESNSKPTETAKETSAAPEGSVISEQTGLSPDKPSSKSVPLKSSSSKKSSSHKSSSSKSSSHKNSSSESSSHKSSSSHSSRKSSSSKSSSKKSSHSSDKKNDSQKKTSSSSTKSPSKSSSKSSSKSGSSKSSSSKSSSNFSSSSSKKSSSKSSKSPEKTKSSGHRSDKSGSRRSSKDKKSSSNSKSSSKSKESLHKRSDLDLCKSTSNGNHSELPVVTSGEANSALTEEEVRWFEDLEADLDNHNELEECWKIFNEESPVMALKPDLLGQKPKSAVQHESQPTESSGRRELSGVVKKRVAHNPSSIAVTELSFHKAPPERKIFSSPAQAMANRFQRLQEAYNRKTDQLSKSPPTAFAGLVPKQRGEHRVAHVPNAARLAAMSPPRRNSITQPSSGAGFSTAGPNITVAATIGKGEKRIAHTPIVAQSKRPIIPVSYGNKVALNVRQRYLNLFIDECLKFATSEEAAYAKGLEEEAAAYDRSSNKTVYLNVVVNTLKRLRSEAEAGPPPAPPSPPAIVIPDSPPPQQQQVQPQLAQRRPTSHQAMLGGARAAKTSFSIERNKPKPQKEELLRGPLLCKYLSKYILTQEQLIENGYPQANPDAPGKAIIKGLEVKKTYISNSSHRQCSRCQTFYAVDENGLHVRQEECVFHWGNIWKKRIAGSIESRYSCCEGDAESEGCTVGEGHIVDNFDLDKVKGFVQTLEKPALDGNHGVYALDCEMCYTTQGMELTRITVIADNMKPIYETMVKPENPVLDYNTRFSGITKEDLDGVHTSLRDVQAVLLSLFSHKTILIGHSLESDFKALRLIHNTVVDTTAVFPHRRGPPFKRALRTLMAECLNKIIQNSDGGHDSQEDAVACLELMIWKIKEDIKCSR